MPRPTGLDCVARTLVTVLVVLALPMLVHAGAANDAAAQTKSSDGKSSKPGKGADAAENPPRAVADMVAAILAAVHSGDIEELAHAVDWNEMKPDLGPGYVANPVAYWKSISRDGDGRDILDILGKLLARPPAVVPFGRDIENNRLYVWPAFAATPISKLSEAEAAELAGLATPDAVKAMREKDRYSGWRLVIGGDGTWHGFRAD